MQDEHFQRQWAQSHDRFSHDIDAGFTTAIGTFVAKFSSAGGSTAYKFQTPPGTTGTVIVSGVSGSLRNSNGTSVPLVNGQAENVAGGNWTLVTTGNSTIGANGGNGTYSGGSPTTSATPTPYTGAAVKTSASMLALLGVLFVVLL